VAAIHALDCAFDPVTRQLMSCEQPGRCPPSHPVETPHDGNCVCCKDTPVAITPTELVVYVAARACVHARAGVPCLQASQRGLDETRAAFADQLERWGGIEPALASAVVQRAAQACQAQRDSGRPFVCPTSPGKSSSSWPVLLVGGGVVLGLVAWARWADRKS